MAVTYTAIATVTVSSATAASIDFANIPGTYTDLAVLFSGRTDQANVYGTMTMRLNASTSSYSGLELVGTGSTVENTSRNTFQSGMYILNTCGDSSTASTFGSHFIYIPNFAGSNNKPVVIDAVTENNATEAYAGVLAGLWSNTAAITQITFYANTGNNFKQYTTATLYGIKATV